MHFLFCDCVSSCRVGYANGNHFGFQLVTRSSKPTLRNGYVWVIPQVTLGAVVKTDPTGNIFAMVHSSEYTNINDLKNHYRHRDRHGKQLENLVRLLGRSPEPMIPHPSGRERRQHCLIQDVGAILFTRSSSVIFHERLMLPFSSDEILSGYEDTVFSRHRPIHYVGEDRPQCYP